MLENLSQLDELKDLKAIASELNKQRLAFRDQHQQTMIELKNAKTKENANAAEKTLDELENKLALCHDMDIYTYKELKGIEVSRARTKIGAMDIKQYFDQKIARLKNIEKEINAACRRQREAAKALAELNIEEGSSEKE